MNKSNMDITNKAKEYRADGNYEDYAALCKEHSVPEDRKDQFWNNMIDELAPPTNESATDKLDRELKEFKGGNKEKAVSKHVAKTLKSFCKNEIFASAVAKCEKTLSDCVSAIMKGVGNSISDIEVYRRAAKFYFPDTTVKFNMEIVADGLAAKADEVYKTSSKVSRKKPVKEVPSTIQISLFEE